MNVGGDYGDGARLSRSNEPVGHGKNIQQAKTRAADIERTTVFASEKLGVKER